MKFAKIALITGLAGVLQFAGAQVFTLQAAYYTLDSSGPFNFNYQPNDGALTVDFTPTAPAFKVGDSTGYSSGTATIIYTVNSPVPILGIDLVLQGNVIEWGEINYTEIAEAGAMSLGSISGQVVGSMRGGTDGAFSIVDHLDFNQAVQQFKVKKTFDIDIAPEMAPSTSLANVSVIEQNMDPVPEPASLAAIGVGLAALLARKRRK